MAPLRNEKDRPLSSRHAPLPGADGMHSEFFAMTPAGNIFRAAVVRARPPGSQPKEKDR